MIDRPATSVVHVQTKREIVAALSAAGIRPRKRFGQNFLIDGNLMRRLVSAAQIGPKDTVLEVGAGTGGLTDLLAAAAGSVICVEIDPNLCALLARRFARAHHVRLLDRDALAGKNEIDPQVVSVLRDSCAALGGPALLVANLPYQIATPLVGNILVALRQIQRLCFTVQAEVGERMVAAPGCEAYGPISVLVQLLCRVEVVARIPPQAFWPAPKVESVMLRLDVTDSISPVSLPGRGAGVRVSPVAGAPLAAASGATRTPAPKPDLPSLAALVRGMFTFRRKTLRAGLKKWLSFDPAAEMPAAFDWSLRPDAVAPPDWVQLHNLLVRAGLTW